MRVLVIGSGGRESALVWALQRSASVREVLACPGNPGIASIAEIIDADLDDLEGLVDVARRVRPHLVVVGPEGPLVAGFADAVVHLGVKVFGPSAAAARIEGSKSYAKELMDRAGVPTARAASFEDAGRAAAFLDELGPPYVIKADGLAAGKGVVVTEDRDEAVRAIDERLVQRRFGEAGSRVVIEEFLDGEEASLIAFVDGAEVVACEPAQDYKRALDGDAGPNTGGMGSYSPVPACPPELAERITDEVLKPMVAATAAAGAPFVGALYAGLALSAEGPRVIEFNARFGDPETQALLPRLRSDLGELCLACAQGSLAGAELMWDPRPCVTVVLASGGYPGSYDTGHAITGLSEAARVPEVYIFHAGTARRDGAVVTAGGRVLAVAALGDGMAQARRRAYEAASSIYFDGKHTRSDIALRAESLEGASS